MLFDSYLPPPPIINTIATIRTTKKLLVRLITIIRGLMTVWLRPMYYKVQIDSFKNCHTSTSVILSYIFPFGLEISKCKLFELSISEICKHKTRKNTWRSGLNTWKAIFLQVFFYVDNENENVRLSYDDFLFSKQ